MMYLNQIWRPRSRQVCSVVFALFVGLMGCQEDEPAVEEAKKKAAEVKKAKEATEAATMAIAVPISPMELFQKLPKTPPGLAGAPGSTLAEIKKKSPAISPSSYSDRFHIERPADGPFRLIHYQLDAKRDRVEAVLATFREGYEAQARQEALLESIQIRLGKGETFDEEKYRGNRWKLIDFRIDLRRDKTNQALELLMHSRGRFDPIGKPTPSE